MSMARTRLKAGLTEFPLVSYRSELFLDDQLLGFPTPHPLSSPRVGTWRGSCPGRRYFNSTLRWQYNLERIYIPSYV